MGQTGATWLAFASILAMLLSGCQDDISTDRAGSTSAVKQAEIKPGEIRYQARSMDEITSLLDEFPDQGLNQEQRDALAFIRAADANDSDTVGQLIADGREAAAQIGDVTALHFAVRNGNIHIIKLLLDADDNRDYGLPGEDQLLLELACRGMDDILLRTLQNAGLNTQRRGRYGFDPLDLVYIDNPAMLDILLEERPNEYTFRAMLDNACKSSDPAYLQKLIHKHGNIREEPGVFHSALHNRKMMQVLIGNGLDIPFVESTATYEGDDLPNPLVGSLDMSFTIEQIIDPDFTLWIHRPFTGEHDSIKAILQFLYENGADFESTIGESELPAWQFQIKMTPELEVLQAFKAMGYDPMTDWNDNTGRGYPDYLLIGGAEGMERALEAGKDILPDWQELGFDLSARIPDGRSLLGEALIEGYTELKKALLEKGVEVDLQEAAGLGRLEDLRELFESASGIEQTRACSMAALLKHDAVFEMLLELGAQAETRDLVLMGRHDLLESVLQDGRDPDTFIDDTIELPIRGLAAEEPLQFTAVRAACYADDEKALKLLEEFGADLEVDNEEKAGLPVPIEICVLNGSENAVDFLIDEGVITTPDNIKHAASQAISEGQLDFAAHILERLPEQLSDWDYYRLAREYADAIGEAGPGDLEILREVVPGQYWSGFINNGLLTEVKQLAGNYNKYPELQNPIRETSLRNVRVWLESGADPNSRDPEDQLSIDSSNGVMELAVRSGNSALLELLIEFGGELPPASELAPLLLQDYLLGEIRLHYHYMQY